MRAAALVVEPLGLVAGPFVAVAVPAVPARAALVVLVVLVVASGGVVGSGHGAIVRAAAIAVGPRGLVAGPFVAVAVTDGHARVALVVIVVVVAAVVVVVDASGAVVLGCRSCAAGPFVAVAFTGVPARDALVVLVVVVAAGVVVVDASVAVVLDCRLSARPSRFGGSWRRPCDRPILFHPRNSAGEYRCRSCPNGRHILRERKEEGGKCSLRPPSRAGAEALECRALSR